MPSPAMAASGSGLLVVLGGKSWCLGSVLADGAASIARGGPLSSPLDRSPSGRHLRPDRS